MINYKTSGAFFVVETPKKGGGNIEAIYPRQYFALKVGDDAFQVLNVDTKARLYFTNIADVTLDGVVYTDVDLFIKDLNTILFSNGAGSGSSDALLQQIVDNTANLKPEEAENFIITEFTKTPIPGGGFEYKLLQSVIGITLINSVTEKTGMLSLNYTITPTNDVLITSTIEYPIDTKIRISGQA
jgi:hypothetical protein